MYIDVFINWNFIYYKAPTILLSVAPTASRDWIRSGTAWPAWRYHLFALCPQEWTWSRRTWTGCRTARCSMATGPATVSNTAWCPWWTPLTRRRTTGCTGPRCPVSGPRTEAKTWPCTRPGHRASRKHCSPARSTSLTCLTPSLTWRAWPSTPNDVADRTLRLSTGATATPRSLPVRRACSE